MAIYWGRKKCYKNVENILNVNLATEINSTCINLYNAMGITQLEYCTLMLPPYLKKNLKIQEGTTKMTLTIRNHNCQTCLEWLNLFNLETRL